MVSYFMVAKRLYFKIPKEMKEGTAEEKRISRDLADISEEIKMHGSVTQFGQYLKARQKELSRKLQLFINPNRELLNDY